MAVFGRDNVRYFWHADDVALDDWKTCFCVVEGGVAAVYPCECLDCGGTTSVVKHPYLGADLCLTEDSP